MTILRTSFLGDQNLGLYGFATDAYCLSGYGSKKMKETLKVHVHAVNLLNISFAGIFVAGNSHGIIVNNFIKENEHHNLKRHFQKILSLKTKYTAMGNLVLMNDRGAVISPLIKKHKKEIADFFGFRCEVGTIAKQRIVGTLGIATNKGCLLHPKARKSEMELIADVLGVECNIGTVNYGSPYPKSGIIANSNGCIVSERTSGPELGRIVETLGFL